MDLHQIIDFMEQNKNQRGIDNWNKLANSASLKSYGIGLTVLRKFAKTIGKNRELASQLWVQDIYETKVLSLLVDDPKQITVEQAEMQVESVNIGELAHVFSSCDATLAKSPIAFSLAQEWLKSADATRRRCSLGLIYEFSKKKSKAYTDDFFMSVIDTIKTTYGEENKKVLLAMGGALLGIGKRNLQLNKAALALAKEIGPIDFNEDGQSCAPFDVVKHLNSESLRKKLEKANTA